MERVPVWLIATLGAALGLLGVLSLCLGPAPLSVRDIITGLIDADSSAAIIVREIRLPRTLLAIGVGTMLGLCGAAAQSLTRNPLAEPAIFGTPQAAALGAVIVLYTGLAPAISVWLPIAAIASALASLALIFVLVRRNRNAITLLLAGLGVGALCGAAISFVISFSYNPYAIMEIVFWLMGSFEDRSMEHVLLAAPFLALAWIIILSCGRGYQALTLGEDVATSMGVDVYRIAILTVLGIALGVGAGVAVSGAIGFVGLVAPHAVRRFCGGNPGHILIPSALAGGILTVSADIVVRILPAPGELRIGVLTAFIGVPWFLYLIIRDHGFIQEGGR